MSGETFGEGTSRTIEALCSMGYIRNRQVTSSQYYQEGNVYPWSRACMSTDNLEQRQSTIQCMHDNVGISYIRENELVSLSSTKGKKRT